LRLSFSTSTNLTKGNYMNRHQYLEALETVLAWDLPEEALADAIKHQVMQSIDFEHERTLDNYSSTAMTTNH